MRAPVIAFALGFALSIATGVLAQSSGFPSRPRFQTIGVNTAAPSVGVVVNATSGGAVSRVATGGVNRGDICASATAGACVVGDTVGDVALRTNGGALRISTNDGISAGAYFSPSLINLQATTVQVNGVAVQSGATQKVAYFYNSNFSGGCTVARQSGVSACTRSGVGAYSITLNAGFTSPPVCVISVAEGGHGASSAFASSTTTVAANTLNTANVLDDAVFSLYCVGT